MDLSGDTPTWIIPTPRRPPLDNPNIKKGNKSYDDPMGAIGVPGRPGDGFVGSTAGKAGVPPHDPTSSPDDPAENDGDLFCGDIITLPNGHILAAGGTDWYNEPSIMDRNAGDPADVGVIELEGLRSATIFNGETDGYETVRPMKYGRWYPSGLVLPDGKVFVTSGVTQLISNTQLGNVRRSEIFDPGTGTWAEAYTSDQSETSLPLFPRLVLAPNGKIFYGGTGQNWTPGGYDAEEATWGLQRFFDPETKEWETVGLAPLGNRSGAFQIVLPMAPPYDKMTMLTAGGTLGPSPSGYLGTPLATLTTLDANGNVASEQAGDLKQGRWFGTGVPLPDGNVLVVGGADRDEVIMPGIESPVRTPEIYDTRNDRWVQVAEQGRDRTYHHSAVLLPDMRVLLGGHVPIGAYYGGAPRDQGPLTANNDADPSFEIYSPPYLSRGDRPSIAMAQKGVDHGERFPITLTKDEDTESVLLMRMPSVQHTIDNDQRTLLLDFEKTGAGSLVAVAPGSAVTAPPGYYYLVVNKKTAQGPVPSTARMVRVGLGRDQSPSADPFGAKAGPGGGNGATPVEDSSANAQARAAVVEATRDTPAAATAGQVDAAAAAATEPGSATPTKLSQSATEAAGQTVETALAAKPAGHRSPLRSPGPPLGVPVGVPVGVPIGVIAVVGVTAAAGSRRMTRRFSTGR
jgi:hypothetical protein